MVIVATFFVCLCLPANTIFLLAYNLFQCLQPLQTIYFQIFNPPSPRQKINGPSLKRCFRPFVVIL